MALKQTHSYAARFLGTQNRSLKNPRNGNYVLQFKGRPPLKLTYDYSLPVLKCQDLESVDADVKPQRIGYENLIKMGYLVRSVKIISKERWFRRQTIKYTLAHKLDTVPHSTVIYKQYPVGHKVILDTKNNRIRLEGKNAGSKGYGEWSYI